MTRSTAGRGERVLLGREERRDQIIQAAAQAFLRRGFAATTVDEIAEAAGVTKVLIYRHFSTKREIYLAVLGRAWDRLAATGDQGPDADRLSRLVQAADQDPDGFRILFRHVRREPEFADYVRDLDETQRATSNDLLAVRVHDRRRRAWLAAFVPELAIQAILAWLDTDRPIPAADLITAIHGMAAAAIGKDAR
ncbi:TetR/AcrR family transcriptional regulator [Microlunatus speluncae]|uniref:TetR/AcrR family transcriptional regulator n=1 Tax=Microlunatus speluncae TaxID=2594267 RepID=UPI0013758E5E|nr:TetR/AcrR family transcriptional regulator [Microlunatus speluncae]